MLTKKELAEFLKVHVNTIDNFVRQGMPHYRFGKSVRFDQTEVLEWFKKKGE